MKKYIKLIRVEQWVKNVFVFLPAFFSGYFLESNTFLQSIFAFFIFSITASSIYIINDYLDIESDRQHPEKCKRPLASGAISKAQAKIIFVGLILFNIIAIISGQYIFENNLTKFGIIIAGYFFMNIAYTLKLKHIAIIDINIIALGFVFRVLAGGYMTGIIISQWTILLTFVLALVLAIGKRRGELVNAQISGKTRKALDGYNILFADIVLAICCTLAIISYVMFAFSDDIQNRFGEKFFYTIFFVMFAFLRYLQQTLVYNKTESPTKIVYKDRYIQITMLLWLISFILLIYFKDEA